MHTFVMDFMKLMITIYFPWPYRSYVLNLILAFQFDIIFAVTLHFYCLHSIVVDTSALTHSLQKYMRNDLQIMVLQGTQWYKQNGVGLYLYR